MPVYIIQLVNDNVIVNWPIIGFEFVLDDVIFLRHYELLHYLINQEYFYKI